MTVDELVFELNLDPRGFDEGQKHALDSFRKMSDEMDKRQKELEARNKNVGNSFQNISYAAEGLFTALAGAGMAAFARDTMQTVSATGRMAVNIGESTNALSAFGRMIERDGGDAGSATGSLKGLADAMTRLNTFGEGSQELFKFLGIIGGQQGDSPLQTFMRFAEWAEKNKNNPQLVNIIGQAGGLDQGSINEALKGHTQVLLDYQAALAGAVNPADVNSMVRMQDAWATLDQKITDVGRHIVTEVEPAFSSMAGNTSAWLERNQQLATSLGEILAVIVGISALKPAAWVLRLLGLGALIDIPTAAVAAGVGVVGAPLLGLGLAMTPTTLGDNDEMDPRTGQPRRHGQAGSGGVFTSQADKEAFIRQTAINAGINPDIAMRVARSEGFNGFESGIPGEKSYGAFQLHVTPGGRGHAVGDEFQKLTGLDPSDRNNEHETIMFALEWAKRHGWGDFHGAANTGIGAHQGIGDINVTVQTTSTNPREHGRIAGQEVRNQVSNIATQANTGLQ